MDGHRIAYLEAHMKRCQRRNDPESAHQINQAAASLCRCPLISSTRCLLAAVLASPVHGGLGPDNDQTVVIPAPACTRRTSGGPGTVPAIHTIARCLKRRQACRTREAPCRQRPSDSSSCPRAQYQDGTKACGKRTMEVLRILK